MRRGNLRLAAPVANAKLPPPGLRFRRIETTDRALAQLLTRSLTSSVELTALIRGLRGLRGLRGRGPRRKAGVPRVCRPETSRYENTAIRLAVLRVRE
jgi:hypothetical protein